VPGSATLDPRGEALRADSTPGRASRVAPDQQFGELECKAIQVSLDKAGSESSIVYGCLAGIRTHRRIGECLNIGWC